MKGYSEKEIFTRAELDVLARASHLVAKIDVEDFETTIRCHELARAVGRLLGLRHEDGVYSANASDGGVDHSWLLVPNSWGGCSILDVYAVGRLPQVQLVYCGVTVPHHQCFLARAERDDIDVEVMNKLAAVMERHEQQAKEGIR
jgi:hypothetical protein